MCEVSKSKLEKMLEGIDISEYSHMLICINRLNGCCTLKFASIGEKLRDVIGGVK